MTTFLQIHALKSYSAANLNRDDTGSPKTLMYGQAERLRVSSQSLKRAWRTSPEFRTRIGEENIGARTQEFATKLRDTLVERGVDRKTATERVRKLIEDNKLGKLEKEKRGAKEGDDAPVETNQLVHLGQDELASLNALADLLVEGDAETKDALILQRHPKAIDIALFGRMLADNPGYNVEAACQVAHAFTTHRVSVEDDFYTAVDDLKAVRPGADAGAGFIGSFLYGAGVFYHYVCVNVDLLKENLQGDEALAAASLQGLVEAMAIANPKGKQNSTAAHARASYMRVEVGANSPRSLAEAFLRPTHTGQSSHEDLVAASIKDLEKYSDALDHAYGECVKKSAAFKVGGEGTLAQCLDFAAKSVNYVDQAAE